MTDPAFWENLFEDEDEDGPIDDTDVDEPDEDAAVSNELKPCPFCGGEADFVHDLWQLRIQCSQCGAQTDYAKAITPDQINDAKIGLSLDWNTRMEQ